MKNDQAVWWGLVAFKITLVVTGALMSYLQSPWWAVLVFFALTIG